MSDYLATLFNADGFMPHGHCFLWLPEILWLHVVSDIVIGLSYYSIPFAIIYFAFKRQDLPFRYVFLLFGAFIVLCGATHFFSVWVLWYPDYGPEGIVKALTAIVSVITAVIVWKSIPAALTLPSPLQLQEMNSKLKQTNLHIEQEVAKRTAELGDSERKLQQSQKMEAIGNLTGGMAHDFNNLLSVIIGNLDSLDEHLEENSEAHQLAQASLKAALRGADLTRRLLAFARQQPLQPRATDINKLIEDIAKLLGRILGENIKIFLSLAPDIWQVIIDPVQLDAALTNLATNARDAMPKGGNLMITTSNRHLDAEYAAQHPEVTAGDYAMIEVSDTGNGIPPEVIGRIFEPFFTTKARDKGTGLGLSMVFGFIKQSNGHISVYSEAGSGTTFRLYLPRVAAKEIPETNNHAPVSAKGGHEKILVVEDNDAVRKVTVRQLQELGYSVIEFTDAAKALEFLTAGNQVDLLFTDIIMPGKLNGLDLARTATQRWPALKILLTSGFSEEKLNGHEDSATNGLRLISKPYRKHDLAVILREILENRKA